MKIERIDGPDLILKLIGGVNEDAKEPLSRIPGMTGTGIWKLDCSEITMVNSIGVIGWLSFMRRVKSTISLISVPMVLLDTAAMVDNFLGNAKIESIECIFICNACANEFHQFREFDRDLLTMQSQCPGCGDTSQLTGDSFEIIEELLETI